MSRLFVCLIALSAIAVPAISEAQLPVVPGFDSYCVTPSGGVWTSGQRCVQRVVTPPTGVPAWLEPTPAPLPVPPMPAVVAPVYPAPIYVPPAPVYPAPIYVPPAPIYVPPVPSGGGLDPSIILAGRPAAIQTPFDAMSQLLLLERLAAARPPRAPKASKAPKAPKASTPVVAAPLPPAAFGGGLMGEFRRAERAATSPPVTPAFDAPPAASGDGWMSGFIKGPKS